MSNYNFKGMWIGADMTLDDRFAPVFKKEFTLSKAVRAAKIAICGLGLFELKINGKLPDDTVLNPPHSQYTQTVLYRVFDITDLLEDGNNTITVELGHSFFNETTH
ncbi:MAG: alpha-L-rhamnosidase N-terminal domain-containing protein, partial [Clostridia bacterium]|nr:alpha-L-rhamnosidase N-terminal domain-containing protein [Clostridia bacterium]